MGTPSGQSQPSTSGGTGSGTTPQSQGLPASSALLQLSKRRRGLGVVTPNACTECRKKRAKVSSLCWMLPIPQPCEPSLGDALFLRSRFFLHGCGRDWAAQGQGTISVLTRLHSVTDRNLAAAAGPRMKWTVSTRYPSASQKNTCAMKSRTCACASGPTNKSLLL